ncbi:MAG: ubiquinol oxidase subunit II [Lysobacteraceae bacterium]|nr:MAG: ubiquinol oxidase subunit II [Xanthomonadaceae bacterium]
MLPLAGCNTLLLNPPGDVAAQQGNLIVVSTLLMLLIILPVIALTLFFAWRYRASNKEATYAPDWDHSTQLELAIWAAPLLIIIALGAITWVSTHTLDPYRPVERIAAGRPLPANVKPLVIEVVALDWKWLFLYPEQDIAMVNELAVPVDRPVQFKITGSTVMNSFYIPALAGQIYAMPGMQTQLHAVMNAPGVYDGFSANYSGAGFSSMRFKLHGLDDAGFEQWVAKAKASESALSREVYLELEKPSEKVAPVAFARVAPGLYEAVLNRCVDTQKMCMDQMMAIDANGGQGVRENGTEALAERRRGDVRGGRFVSAEMCRIDEAAPVVASSASPVPRS